MTRTTNMTVVTSRRPTLNHESLLDADHMLLMAPKHARRETGRVREDSPCCLVAPTGFEPALPP